MKLAEWMKVIAKHSEYSKNDEEKLVSALIIAHQLSEMPIFNFQQNKKYIRSSY